MTVNHYKFDNEEQFWIAHDPALHFGKAGGAKVISTGQTSLEIFNDEQEWADRVVELGGEPYPKEEDDESNDELE